MPCYCYCCYVALSFLQEGKGGTDPDMDITKDPYDGKGSINDILQLGGLIVKDGCPPLVCESHCAGVDAPVFGLVSMGVPHKVEGTRSTPRLPS